MAQKVVDMGYDLPLPYGIGLTFAHVDQEMLLGELERELYTKQSVAQIPGSPFDRLRANGRLSKLFDFSVHTEPRPGLIEGLSKHGNDLGNSS